MIRACFSLIAVFAFSTALFAETVQLRTAEHGDFTRIVFDTSAPEVAKIDRRANTVVIQFSSGDTVDISQAFDRIGRERIRDIARTKSGIGITVTLACECEIAKSITPGAMLILDVVPPRAATGTSTMLSENGNWPSRLTRSSAKLSFNALESGVPRAGTALNKASNSGGYVHIDVGKAPNLSDLRLIAQLELKAPAEPRDDSAAQIGSELAGHLSFQMPTMLERHNDPDLEDEFQKDFPDCDQFALANPTNWPTTQDAIAELGRLRLSFTTEGGSIDPRAAIDLASAYLSLAMGAEATMVLSQLSDQSDAAVQLTKMAWLIDGEPAEQAKVAQNDLHCADALVVTALLANAPVADERLAQAQFDTWPEAVKGVLSAPFAEVLLRSGQADSASFVLRRAAQAPEQQTGERALSQARIAMAKGDRGLAGATLQRVIEADQDVAPEALAQLAELANVGETPANPPDTQMLAVYAEELAQTERAPDLLRAQFKGLLRAGEFGGALDVFAEYQTLTRQSQQDLLLDEMGAAIHAVRSDTAFMREAVGLPPAYFRRIQSTTQGKIKARLVELGFSDLATQLGSHHSGRHRTSGANKNAPEPKAGRIKPDSTVQKTRPQGATTAGQDASNLQGPVQTALASALSGSSKVLEQTQDLNARLTALGF